MHTAAVANEYGDTWHSRYGLSNPHAGSGLVRDASQNWSKKPRQFFSRQANENLVKYQVHVTWVHLMVSVLVIQPQGYLWDTMAPHTCPKSIDFLPLVLLMNGAFCAQS